jgi:hypothetical protein
MTLSLARKYLLTGVASGALFALSFDGSLDRWLWHGAGGLVGTLVTTALLALAPVLRRQRLAE